MHVSDLDEHGFQAVQNFAANKSGNLGECVLAGDLPFSGMGLDIFNRRVQGVSWKDIADEFNLGTPSKARSTFTKLTGVTDYKIKGPNLIKLAQGGIDPKLTVPLKVKKAAKITKAQNVNAPTLKHIGADLHKKFDGSGYMKNVNPLHNSKFYLDELKMSEKQYNFLLGKVDAVDMTPGDLSDIYKKLGLPKPKMLDDVLKDIKNAGKGLMDDVPVTAKWDSDLLSQPKAMQVKKLDADGKGYTAIKKETGLDFPDIDEIVWNNNLLKADGDVWKAYLKKPTSENGFNSVKNMVFQQRKIGKTIDEVADITGVDKAVVKAIVEDKWKLPPMGSTKPFIPADPNYYGGGAKPTGSATVPKGLASEDFPRLSTRAMGQYMTNPNLTDVQKAAMRRYTAGSYDVNGALRSGNIGSLRKQIDDMDAGMITTTRPMTVSRGMGRDGFSMGHLSDAEMGNLPGVMVRDRAYLSTSVKDVFTNQVRFIIECPPGTKGHYVGQFSAYKNEAEFIMARDTHIMITKAEKVGGQWLVYGRVVV